MRPNTQETAYLVTFTGEILNAKLHFLFSDRESQVSEKFSLLLFYVYVATHTCFMQIVEGVENLKNFSLSMKMLVKL